MTYVETRVSVWDAITGQTTDRTGDDAAQDPSWVRPVLRDGVECANRVSARGVGYVMLRSPDDREPRYLRLTPQEWQLAQLMDGTLTVARLVAEFARIGGRLAPDQVRRVVADLAANRMLDTGTFRDAHEKRPGLLDGRRLELFNADPLLALLHRTGGRLLFTRTSAVAGMFVAVAGLVAFGLSWWRGTEQVFLAADSYVLGILLLLVLNLVASGVHELGRGLATKHASGRVRSSGLLLQYGLPTVYVDTSEAWLAGRRSRIRVNAAGPAATLVVAGVVQGLALAVPALGSLAFTFAFVAYVGTLVQLCPFAPLDGYHLMLDWLEIPNLRGRGLARLHARLRRSAPALSALDKEGRLVVLYGVLIVLWLVVCAAVAWRVFSDRIGGLATGLWAGGIAGRLLFVIVLAVLLSPLLWFLTARAAGGWAAWRTRASDEKRDSDAPRRLAALRASDLGRLPLPALTSLANRASWVRPTPGEHLVVAGTGQSAVYVVVDGVVHGRRAGDPGGGIRHRTGPGGVIGLADALSGQPSGLDWYTAGTTLLALPPAVVSTVIGPLPGPPSAERAQAEALFDDTPALTGLSADDRLGLLSNATVLDLEPGAPVHLPGPTHAVIVESGVIAMPDGTELRRGTLIGPVGEGVPGVIAQTRTPVRLWMLPDALGLPPVVGGYGRGAESAPPVGATPKAGLYPRTGYPPLAVPPGPPAPGQNLGTDERFERRLWWLVMALALLAGSLAGLTVLPAPRWAEMPSANAMLAAERGGVTAVVDGTPVRLDEGDRRYVGADTRIDVAAGSAGRLTFRGGSAMLLCAGSRAVVGGLSTRGRVPQATVTLESGRLLAGTTPTGGAFEPLDLEVRRTGGSVSNVGAAWYAVDVAEVAVSSGTVTSAGAAVAPTGAILTCGDDVPARTPTAPPSASPSDLPSAVSSAPSLSPSPTPPVLERTPSVSPRNPSPTPSRAGTTPTPSQSPSPQPTVPSPSPSPTTQSPSPPTTDPSPTGIDRSPPPIGSAVVSPVNLFRVAGCARTATVSASVQGATAVNVDVTVVGSGTTGSVPMSLSVGTSWSASVGRSSTPPPRCGSSSS